jgi:hypothetical protein
MMKDDEKKTITSVLTNNRLEEQERITTKSQNKTVNPMVTENPLDGEQLLIENLFGGGGKKRTVVQTAPAVPSAPVARKLPESSLPVARPPKATPKPSHYKIVSISLYNEDIERLENMVRELKRRGHYKANKSQLIRHALAKLDLNLVPNDL